MHKLNGPIALSSLPNLIGGLPCNLFISFIGRVITRCLLSELTLKFILLAVEATVTRIDDLLFDKEFLKSSVDKATVPPRSSDACYTRFRPKHLNIIDPLKECNNLGRSVNRGLN